MIAFLVPKSQCRLERRILLEFPTEIVQIADGLVAISLSFARKSAEQFNLEILSKRCVVILICRIDCVRFVLPESILDDLVDEFLQEVVK